MGRITPSINSHLPPDLSTSHVNPIELGLESGNLAALGPYEALVAQLERALSLHIIDQQGVTYFRTLPVEIERDSRTHAESKVNVAEDTSQPDDRIALSLYKCVGLVCNLVESGRLLPESASTIFAYQNPRLFNAVMLRLVIDLELIETCLSKAIACGVRTEDEIRELATKPIDTLLDEARKLGRITDHELAARGTKILKQIFGEGW